MKEWNWIKGGIALAMVTIVAIVLVKPIGVSTQYVITNAVIWSWFDSELISTDLDPNTGKTVYRSTNAYLNKSNGKYAKAAANPINYGYIFVLSMIGGAFLSVLLGGPKTDRRDRRIPAVWRQRFGSSAAKRYAVAFAGGALVLFGARLAGGCTSGHMLSGITQTALSGYLFAAAVFATAIPTALLLFRSTEGE